MALVEEIGRIVSPDPVKTEATIAAGAARGAITGATVAGPVGAVVGGIVGAVSGFFSSKAAKKAKRRLKRKLAFVKGFVGQVEARRAAEEFRERQPGGRLARMAAGGISSQVVSLPLASSSTPFFPVSQVTRPPPKLTPVNLAPRMMLITRAPTARRTSRPQIPPNRFTSPVAFLPPAAGIERGVANGILRHPCR